MLNLSQILEEIQKDDNLSFDVSFKYAQYCSLITKTNEKDARVLVINVLDNWHKLHPSTIEMWSDIVESVGFYPYIELKKDYFSVNNLYGELRKELHLSENLQSKYFHEEQYRLLKLIQTGKNVIVSAPTSFGKSLLIEEVVAARTFKNIIIIQPTLALLDETRRKLLKYKSIYKLIVRTSQEPSDKIGNIFLFTAERVNEYHYFPKIDFLVIDEFYKLSGLRDDERSSSLNSAFYNILKRFNPQFYLLGPNIDQISEGFANKFNATFFKSDYSLVDSRTINVYKLCEREFNSVGKTKKKEGVLFDLLLKLKDEQSIIYCSSPNRVRGLSKKFIQFLKELNLEQTKKVYPLTEWIEVNVNKDWDLVDNLKYEIGIHDGALQKHISSSIIEYFNEGKLKYLFCTSTIIEGVNTSAKNIIYFDDTKGGTLIDFFDYSNIKGRAGRMMEHFVGTIYNFNKPPENINIVIDIPFFEQDPIKNELLIQIEESEVVNKQSSQFLELQKIPDLDKEIIKKNGVQVNGQKIIFEILRAEIISNYNLISWNIPDYNQLEYILGLAWDNLIMDGETISPMTKKMLINRTFNYGIEKNINSLIDSDFSYKRGLKTTKRGVEELKHKNTSDKDLMNLCIQNVFQMMKHWFEYKVPKWLSVINEIQKLACVEKGLKPGNYRIYANMIENDFVNDNLAILSEYGVPNSAIKKLQGQIPKEIHEDNVIDFIKERNLHKHNRLLNYEQSKLDNL